MLWATKDDEGRGKAFKIICCYKQCEYGKLSATACAELASVKLVTFIDGHYLVLPNVNGIPTPGAVDFAQMVSLSCINMYCLEQQK